LQFIDDKIIAAIAFSVGDGVLVIALLLKSLDTNSPFYLHILQNHIESKIKILNVWITANDIIKKGNIYEFSVVFANGK
jgi:hypothetical protein